MQSKTGDIPDIWALQTRLLQDLMYLALTSSGVDNSWVATYHSLLLQKEHGPFGSAFAGPLERISRVGVRDFSVDDMDVSVICRVLNSKKIRKELGITTLTTNVISPLNNIRDDRNGLYAHSSRNESSFDQLRAEIVAHEHLVRLVRRVETHSQFDEAARGGFCKRWNAELSTYEQRMREEFKSIEEKSSLKNAVQSDVTAVLQDSDPSARFGDLLRENYSNALTDSRNPAEARMRYLEFVSACADANVASACAVMGRFYFHGSAPYVHQDLGLAARYYLAAGSSLGRVDCVNLANLLVNELVPGHNRAEGEALLARVRRSLRPGESLVRVNTRNGHKRWKITRRQIKG